MFLLITCGFASSSTNPDKPIAAIARCSAGLGACVGAALRLGIAVQ